MKLILNRMKSLLVLSVFLTACQTTVGKNSTDKASGSYAGSYSGIGTESVDPKTLATYAAPALPQDLTRQLQMYLDLTAPGMGVLHPTKPEIYFSWRVTGVTQVWKMQKGKFPIQMTGGEDATSLNVVTPDGRYLVVSRDVGGEENPGLYLQSVNGGALRMIQHKKKVQTDFEFVTDNGKYIYYRANDIDPESYAIYRYEVSSGKIELVFDQKGTWSVADHKNDGRLLLSKAITNVASEFYEWSPKTKSLTPILGQNEIVDYDVSYSPVEGEFVVRTNKFGDFHRLYRLRGGKWLELSDKNLRWDIAGFNLSRDRKYLTYQINENGFTKLVLMKTSTSSSWSPVSLPKLNSNIGEVAHVYTGAWSWDSSKVMLGFETSKSPRISYSLDLRTMKLDQWVLPSSPEVDTTAFVSSTIETYKSRDGVDIPMLVYTPKQCGAAAAKPCPVIIHFHGGPEAQSQPGFDLWAQLFVSRGFIWAEPNVRGSDGYGKTWLAADDKEKRWNVITDIQDAGLDAKKRWARNGIAPKVGVYGGSYGGYSTLFAMTYFSGTYEAGVSNVGMSNLLTFIQNTAAYRRHLRTPEYGDPASQEEIMKKLSPITYLDKVSAPVMIIQGANDPRVPVGEAIQMYKAMQKKGLQSELIIFADEGHGASKRSNRVLERGHTLQFFEKHLKN